SVPFEERDLELLTALGAIIAAGIRHAEIIDARRERPVPRKAGGGTRKVTLPGRPFITGRALGALAALRRPGARPSDAKLPHAVKEEQKLLRGAFDVADKAVRGLAERALSLRLGNDAGFLATYVDILGDMRFRERADELVATGAGIPRALGRVA